MEILKRLTMQPNLRFNQIEVKGLESEHMNYHLKQLLMLKLVNKREDGSYELTDSGKDYTNLLDDDVQIIEKQPKTSIIIRGVRKNSETGKIEHLMNKRLKHPYFGKVGRITGKVRFGETFEEAASRELFEETGLSAKSFVLEEVYRKMRKREDGEFVQDVVFYIFNVRDFEGALIEKSDIQENFWDTTENLKKRDDTYDDLDVEDRLEPLELKIKEHVALAEGF
jgi:ADP-ribose pyrophosphatase YjhB (NUDIX family)